MDMHEVRGWYNGPSCVRMCDQFRHEVQLEVWRFVETVARLKIVGKRSVHNHPSFCYKRLIKIEGRSVYNPPSFCYKHQLPGFLDYTGYVNPNQFLQPALLYLPTTQTTLSPTIHFDPVRALISGSDIEGKLTNLYVESINRAKTPLPNSYNAGRSRYLTISIEFENEEVLRIGLAHSRVRPCDLCVHSPLPNISRVQVHIILDRARGPLSALRAWCDEKEPLLRKQEEEQRLEKQRIASEAATAQVEGEQRIRGLIRRSAINTLLIPAMAPTRALPPPDADRLLRIPGVQEEAEAHVNSGNVHANRGDYRRAIKAFTRAVLINPKFADAYHNRAIVQFYLGNNKEAWSDVLRCRKEGGTVNEAFLEVLSACMPEPQ